MAKKDKALKRRMIEGTRGRERDRKQEDKKERNRGKVIRGRDEGKRREGRRKKDVEEVKEKKRLWRQKYGEEGGWAGLLLCGPV